MTVWQAILLGLVQGCTEFLPISSSGHLVLIDHLMHISTNALALDTMLHLGTLVAVILAYRRELTELIRQPFGKLAQLLVVATIPTVIIGLLFEKTFERIFHSGATIGAEFVFTGALLLYTELRSQHSEGRKSHSLRFRSAFLIGLAQGAAIMPALSRSGLTLCAAIEQGVERTEAVRFSFLLSIPVILGATLLQSKEWLSTGAGMPSSLWWGLGASMLSGYLAIRLFTRFIAHHRLHVFGIYTMALGCLILVDQLVTHHWF